MSRERVMSERWSRCRTAAVGLFALGLAVASAPAGAQTQDAPDIAWSYLTEMAGLQSFHGIDVRPDGGIVAVGSGIIDAGFTALYAILSPEGDVVKFEQLTGDGMRAKSTDVAILPSGITGLTFDRWQPGDSYVAGLVIFDANHLANIYKGTIELARNSFSASLDTTANGNFVLAQPYSPGGSLAADAFLIWFAPSGSVRAHQQFQGPEDTGIGDVAGLPDGDVLAVGWTGTEELEQQWAVRLDRSGTVVSEQTFEFIGRLNGVAALPDGGAVMAGFHWPNPEVRAFHGVVLWTDDDGAVTTQATLDDAWSVIIDAVAAMPDGGAVAVGYLKDDADASSRALAVRFDAAGDVVWRFESDHPLSSNFNDVTVLPDGRIAATGYMTIDGEVSITMTEDAIVLYEDTTEEAVRETEGLVMVFAPES